MSQNLKSYVLILFIGVLLTACAAPTSTPVPAANLYGSQPGDETMMRGDVEIVSASVMTAPPVSVSLSYRLPTPCYQLRVSISQPDSQKRIQLSIYAVAPKDKPCTLMALLTPMQASISLGSYSAGNYTVWINGSQIGEFSLQ
jgi:hypothetical protein